MNRLLIACAAGGLVIAGLAAALIIPGLTHKEDVEIGGPFRLQDGAGRTVTDRDFRGRWMLVYFGYTHCPDACPTTLGDLAAALDKLPAPDRARVAPIFITVDPARDTPAVIGDYAHAFGPAFVGLTGSEAAIADAEREYRVYAQKHPLHDGDYAMDHSSVIYVMGPGGRLAGLLDDQMKPAEMAERLRKLGA
jgi:protein SCO1/2